MIVPQWKINAADSAVLSQVEAFLPDRIFDVHAHIYKLDLLGRQGPLYTEGPKEAGIDYYYEVSRQLYGENRPRGAFFMPPPTSDESMIDRLNEFTADQLQSHPDAVGMLLISPRTDRGLIERLLKSERIVGLKPFAFYSGISPASSSPIGSFLPEWAWELADAHRLILMTHLMMDDAVNDPGNYRTIEAMCKKYPGAVLQLDHIARGFYTQSTFEGLRRMRDLPGVVVDTSAISDAMPMIIAIKELGARRVLFGSDFPLSVVRGKSFALGTGFMWIDEGNVDFAQMAHGAPAFIGLEGLRSLMHAAYALDLSRGDVEDIFYNNAMRLISRRKGG